MANKEKAICMTPTLDDIHEEIKATRQEVSNAMKGIAVLDVQTAHNKEKIDKMEGKIEKITFSLNGIYPFNF